MGIYAYKIEAELLASEEYQKKIADAIAEGTEMYLNSSGPGN